MGGLLLYFDPGLPQESFRDGKVAGTDPIIFFSIP